MAVVIAGITLREDIVLLSTEDLLRLRREGQISDEVLSVLSGDESQGCEGSTRVTPPLPLQFDCDEYRRVQRYQGGHAAAVYLRSRRSTDNESNLTADYYRSRDRKRFG